MQWIVTNTCSSETPKRVCEMPTGSVVCYQDYMGTMHTLAIVDIAVSPDGAMLESLSGAKPAYKWGFASQNRLRGYLPLDGDVGAPGRVFCFLHNPTTAEAEVRKVLDQVTLTINDI